MNTTAPWFDFDIRNDPVFDNIIKPIIENQIAEMAAYDRRRIDHQRQSGTPEITYIFYTHADEVAEDVRKTCVRLGQPENVQNALFWATRLHDLGKTAFPVEIWNSVEKPTGDIKKYRRTHTDRGLEMADNLFKDVADHPFVKLAKDVIRYHHVNIDGSGHPDGVTGDQISDPVKLVCIVESYDGYTKHRPHHTENQDRSPARILERMRTEPDKGAKMFDMDMFEAFAAMKLESSPASTPSPSRRKPNIKN